MLDDRAIHHGGEQCLKFYDGTVIPLKFDGDTTMWLAHQAPTKQELKQLEIHWITPKLFDSQAVLAETNQTSRRRKARPIKDIKNWKKMLGCCSEEVVDKTPMATTQYCVGPIEMENRDSPKQHQKTRLIPLHPQRVMGRTDSDTFFCSLILTRGFSCIQIFLCLVTQLIFIKLMR